MEYKGDFSGIKNSINSCIEGLDGMAEARDVLEVMRYNDFTKKVLGEHQGIYAEIADSVNVVNDRINVITHAVENIAAGDLGQLEEFHQIGKRSENDTLMPAFITMMETINALIGETTMLSGQAELLKEMVGRFHLSNTKSGASRLLGGRVRDAEETDSDILKIDLSSGEYDKY